MAVAPRRARLGDDDRPQADRASLLLDDARVLRGRRFRGADHAHAVGPAEPARRRPGHLRRAFHDARGDDDLLLHHPDDDRSVRQLPAPADDRRTGHGVPAPQRAELLDLPRVGDLRLLEPSHRPGAECRLVRLRAPREREVRPRACGRLLLPRAHLQRNRVEPHRRELHRDDPQVAGARDVLQPYAALLLRLPRGVVRAPLRAAVADGGRDLPLPRPQRRHPLLRRREGRVGAALAAPVLDLRPPRGLHPHRPGVRDRDRDHPRVHAAAGRRVPARGGRGAARRLHRLRRLGAPHVRHGDADGDA